GLLLKQVRVPLGVVAIIYESRPNVTVDSFGLCFKSGNCVILKGSKTAINSNIAIVEIIQDVLAKNGLSPDIACLIKDTRRETALALMKMDKYIDVLVPRGGAELIRSCVENSTIPVIETGTGVCHIFVDKSADFDMALNIIDNAKTQRPGVCNACETLLVHKDIADSFMPLLEKRLPHVELRYGDYDVEFLDLILSVKIVDDLTQAVGHINHYGTNHSEAIITSNYANAQQFLDKVDSACVYVNASTRFSDGEEFGLGAEMGISTQKLHTRGPFALKALTSSKYVIYGNGQIR
ncbi:MAG: glutamate-5-semialdehyde dehydrogenase, partial [Oscillospiraceae bacterium]|nr:glutamate-5-semialdehyde dehydrogenase [Oscillospiraceae bacterium]